MKKFSTAKLALVLTVLMSSSYVMTANASGSFNHSSRSSLQLNFNAGKSVFYRKVSCDKCPLPSKKLDKSSAGEVIQLLETRKDLMTLLSRKERKSAVFYLKTRYKLS